MVTMPLKMRKENTAAIKRLRCVMEQTDAVLTDDSKKQVGCLLH